MSIRINTPDVIQETFDDESVIVNLREGLYYSLNSEALPLWSEIVKGTAFPLLTEAYPGFSPEEIGGFLRELHEERLIVIDEESLPKGKSATSFLQKFEDLQDLLLLDPIHDVDERGWPHAKPSDDQVREA